MTSLVSVIIPTYNSADFLKIAIDSVLQQSYSNYEILVIDDGSTDNTEELMRGYSELVVYIKQSNQGVSAARNTGIKQAKGEFIAFLDADDSWFSDKLTLQIDMLHKYPECIAVFSNFHIVDAQNKLLKSNGIAEDYAIFKYKKLNKTDLFQHVDNGICTGDIFKSLFLGNFINTCSLVIRSESVKKCGFFNTKLITQEDYDYWLRLSMLGKMIYVDKPLLNRSRHGAQLTANDKKLQISTDVASVIEVYAEKAKLLIEEKVYKERLRGVYKVLALNYLASKSNMNALRILKTSLVSAGYSNNTVLLIFWSLLPVSIAEFIRLKILK